MAVANYVFITLPELIKNETTAILFTAFFVYMLVKAVTGSLKQFSAMLGEKENKVTLNRDLDRLNRQMLHRRYKKQFTSTIVNGKESYSIKVTNANQSSCFAFTIPHEETDRVYISFELLFDTHDLTKYVATEACNNNQEAGRFIVDLLVLCTESNQQVNIDMLEICLSENDYNVIPISFNKLAP